VPPAGKAGNEHGTTHPRESGGAHPVAGASVGKGSVSTLAVLISKVLEKARGGFPQRVAGSRGRGDRAFTRQTFLRSSRGKSKSSEYNRPSRRREQSSDASLIVAQQRPCASNRRHVLHFPARFPEEGRLQGRPVVSSPYQLTTEARGSPRRR
jgi:hypothetical protein